MRGRWTEADLARVQGDKYIAPGVSALERVTDMLTVNEDSSEALIQATAVRRLTRMGYLVVVCDNGGHNLNTEGCPDVFVACPGENIWLALEFKSQQGRLRAEQTRLHSQGVTRVVRHVEEAIAAASGLREHKENR